MKNHLKSTSNLGGATIETLGVKSIDIRSVSGAKSTPFTAPAILDPSITQLVDIMKPRFATEGINIPDNAREQLKKAVEYSRNKPALSTLETLQSTFYSALLFDNDPGESTERYKQLAACCFAAISAKSKKDPGHVMFGAEFMDWVEQLQQQNIELVEDADTAKNKAAELRKQNADMAQEIAKLKAQLAERDKAMEDIKVKIADEALQIALVDDAKAREAEKLKIVAEVKAAMQEETLAMGEEISAVAEIIRERFKAESAWAKADLTLMRSSLDGLAVRVTDWVRNSVK